MCRELLAIVSIFSVHWLTFFVSESVIYICFFSENISTLHSVYILWDLMRRAFLESHENSRYFQSEIRKQALMNFREIMVHWKCVSLFDLCGPRLIYVWMGIIQMKILLYLHVNLYCFRGNGELLYARVFESFFVLFG